MGRIRFIGVNFQLFERGKRLKNGIIGFDAAPANAGVPAIAAVPRLHTRERRSMAGNPALAGGEVDFVIGFPYSQGL
jgi:hypothetical protein